jgi:hypothetical protein
VRPCLPIAHATHARKVRAERVTLAQRLQFVDQAGLEDRIEAIRDSLVKQRAVRRDDRKRLQRERQRSRGRGLPRRDRLAGQAPDFERALDALRIPRLNARGPADRLL